MRMWLWSTSMKSPRGGLSRDIKVYGLEVLSKILGDVIVLAFFYLPSPLKIIIYIYICLSRIDVKYKTKCGAWKSL